MYLCSMLMSCLRNYQLTSLFSAMSKIAEKVVFERLRETIPNFKGFLDKKYLFREVPRCWEGLYQIRNEKLVNFGYPANMMQLMHFFFKEIYVSVIIGQDLSCNDANLSSGTHEATPRTTPVCYLFLLEPD